MGVGADMCVATLFLLRLRLPGKRAASFLQLVGWWGIGAQSFGGGQPPTLTIDKPNC
jgi:hypothetical protein